MNSFEFRATIGFLTVAALTIGVPTFAEARAAKYYLTPGVFQGDGALMACAPGYHMASLYEILDTSALEYDLTLGDLGDDGGAGPKSNNSGWIRTGGNSNANTNCNAWTSTSASQFGAVAILQFSASGLNDPATYASPWSLYTGTAPCRNEVNVWCVED